MEKQTKFLDYSELDNEQEKLLQAFRQDSRSISRKLMPVRVCGVEGNQRQQKFINQIHRQCSKLHSIFYMRNAELWDKLNSYQIQIGCLLVDVSSIVSSQTFILLKSLTLINFPILQSIQFSKLSILSLEPIAMMDIANLQYLIISHCHITNVNALHKFGFNRLSKVNVTDCPINQDSKCHRIRLDRKRFSAHFNLFEIRDVRQKHINDISYIAKLENSQDYIGEMIQKFDNLILIRYIGRPLQKNQNNNEMIRYNIRTPLWNSSLIRFMKRYDPGKYRKKVFYFPPRHDRD